MLGFMEQWVGNDHPRSWSAGQALHGRAEGAESHLRGS